MASIAGSKGGIHIKAKPKKLKKVYHRTLLQIQVIPNKEKY